MSDTIKPLHRPQIGLIVLLGSLTAFPAISTDVYLPALPQMTAELYTTPSAAALTLSTFFVGMMAGQFLFGPWSDRAGRRTPLLIGLGVYVIASICCALTTSIELLIFLRFVQAFGGCAAVTIARAVVRDRYDVQSMARIMAYLTLVFGAAPIFGPLLGGAFLLFADWRAIFFFLALFGVACAVSVYFFLPESLSRAHGLRARQETPLESFGALARDPLFLAYALVGGFSTGLMLTYVALSPDLFIQSFGLSAQSFSFLFAANGAGFVAASQLNAFLLRRVSYQRMLRWSSLSAVGLTLLLFFMSATSIGGPWGIGVPLFLSVANNGFIAANAMAGALSAQSDRAGAASSMAGAAAAAGAAIATAIGGALYDGSALAMGSVMLTCAAFGALSLRVLPLFAQRQARFAASTAALKPESENS